VLGNGSQQDQREDDNYNPLHNSSFLSKPASFSAELPGPTVSVVDSVKVADAEVLSSAPSSGEAALMTAFTGERVVAREKGQTKLNYFGQGVSGA
jgi:hypothetical protein